MKRESLLNRLGLLLLLAGFALAAWRVLSRTHQDHNPHLLIIRIAHWQLEPGFRAAIDDVARRYEKLHPGVRIEQIAIPDVDYESWMRTQLAGGTAPDLMEESADTTDEMLARYFVPVTSWVDQPDPYDADNEMARWPWRRTFTDNLQNFSSYNAQLCENYGIPITTITTRVYYNESLWRKVFGDRPAPATYEAFVRDCQEVEAYARGHPGVLIPIAGSDKNGPLIMDTLLSSQTQKLSLDLDVQHLISTPAEVISLAYLGQRWTMASTPLERGFELMREVGDFMQPGFLHAEKDDAVFYFIQGRALMCAGGSYDANSLRGQASFPIGAFAIPLPSPSDPRYGPQTYGKMAEPAYTIGSFILTRVSRHPDAAVDFMRFLTSRDMATVFTNVSSWLPAVRGVILPPFTRLFMPDTQGFPAGFDSNFGWIGAETRRVVATDLFALIGPQGSVAKFQRTMDGNFPAAVAADLALLAKTHRQTAARADSALGALLWQEDHASGADRADLAAKIRQVSESQTGQEMDAYWIRGRLTQLGYSLPR